MNKIKKVALLGPESTGKTELCMRLAAHFHTAWVPEFARVFLSNKNNVYTFEDVLYCMNAQLILEDGMERQAAGFLFCDTELINYKVWFADVFNKVPDELTEKLATHRYDLVLLTSPDIPFEEDPLRTNGNRRDFFFDWYKRELESYNIKYSVIDGAGSKRLENAIAAIERQLQN